VVEGIAAHPFLAQFRCGFCVLCWVRGVLTALLEECVAADQIWKKTVCARCHVHVQAECIEKLLGVMPPSLGTILLQNSGAEAVENAVKIARAATGRQNIIAFDVSGLPHTILDLHASSGIRGSVGGGEGGGGKGGGMEAGDLFFVGCEMVGS
jgi:hypothetical protein